MKTYFLIFEGDPNSRLSPLRKLDPSLSSVTISSPLHCISFGSTLSEMLILNALSTQSPTEPRPYLLPAQLPIHPMAPTDVLAQVSRMIADSDDDTASFAT